MKKIIYIAAITMFLGTASIYAGTFSTSANIFSISKGDKTTKITEEELPAGIKRVLKTDDYKD